jgi:Tfp pilus assembly protein PilN
MEAVNLLPPEYRERKRRRGTPADNLDGRRTVRVGGGVALLFALLLGALFFHEHQVVTSKKKELADNKSQIATLQPQVDAIRTAQAAVSGRLTFTRSITGTRMNWDRALNDFARVVPTNSFLTNIQMTAPVTTASQASGTVATPGVEATPAPAPTPTGVSTLTISGTAPSTPGVALVMDRLALIPWLSGITLTSAARQDTGANNFALSATVSEAH